MKTLRGLLALLIASIVIISCDEREFDMPPLNVPQYDGQATMTIKEFKAKYTSDLIEITDSIVLGGYVVANDISGNIYKQIQLEDETGGICIAIDQNNIYNDYRVGQKMFVECKGLFTGKYGGYHQLGYKYSRNSDGVYSIGQMTWQTAQSHLFLDSYPNPDTVTAMPTTIEQLNADLVGRLVTVSNVYFEKGGEEPFAEKTAEGTVQTQSKNLISASNPNMKLIARNSSAANFSSFTLPEGVGYVTGVLSVYNNSYQITFRDSLDCSPTHFAEGEGNGTKDYPYIIDYVLSHQDGTTKGWIEGYIVGAVAPGVNETNPIDNNSDISFVSPFLNNTVVLASSPEVTDWSKCVVINLPQGSDIRTKVNLLTTPDNKGQKLKVTGTLQKYFGAAGLNVATGGSGEFVFGSSSGGGDGTKDNPYTADQVVKFGKDVNQPLKWVKGYIVGCVPDQYLSNSVFNPPFPSQSNILIASSADETDPNNCVPVQLVQGDIRTALNLVTNVTNEGREVLLNCDLIAYFGVAGIKNITEYEFTTGPGPEPGGDGSGTKDDPYTIAGAQSHQGAVGNTDFYWVKGYIVGSVVTTNGEITQTYVNSNLALGSDAAGTSHVSVQLPAGATRDALNLVSNPGNLGKEVLIYGTLDKYCGIAGVKGVKDYVINAGPSPGDAILDVPFTTSMGGFTTYNVSGDQVWGLTDIYGMVMTGFADDASHANEDWLISPAMDLTGKTAATLTFSHAINKGNVNNLKTNHTLWFSTNYNSGAPAAATWSQVTITTYPTGLDWTFVSSGNISLPASVLGKTNVRFAYKYLCSNTESASWEIKNVLVK